jgi:hypothetical protein
MRASLFYLPLFSKKRIDKPSYDLVRLCGRAKADLLRGFKKFFSGQLFSVDDNLKKSQTCGRVPQTRSIQ